ncbi:MAG: PilZ domain-containing protein [Nitrosomonadales bacterium]|nr:PilZ domain-containing protein [Nitrosomonadales bacterium]
MQIQERRSAKRYPSVSKGYVILNGVDLDLNIRNISTAGILIALSSPCVFQNGAKLCIHLDIGHVGTAVVCRSETLDNQNLVALKFEVALPVSITLQ